VDNQSDEINRHASRITRLDTWGVKIVQAFDAAVGRLESDMKHQADQIAGLRRDLDGHMDDFASLKANVADESKTAAADREVMRKGIAGLKASLPTKAATNSKLEALAQWRKVAEETVGTLRQSSLDRVAEMNALRRDLAATKNELRKAQDDGGTLRTEMQSLRKEATMSKVRVDDLKKAEHDIKMLREELASLRQESTRSEDKQGKDLKKTQDELNTLRKDMRSHQGNETAEYKKVAKDSTSATKEYARELAATRLEIKQLKQDVAEQTRATAAAAAAAQHNHTTAGTSAFSAKELDILTNNITLINKKASQVEPLEMEVQLLKTRVQRVEVAAASASASASAGVAAAASQELLQLQQDQYQHQQAGRISSSVVASISEDDLVFGSLPGFGDGESPYSTSLPPSRPGGVGGGGGGGGVVVSTRKKRTIANREAIPDSTSPNKRRMATTQTSDFGSEANGDERDAGTPGFEWPESSPAGRKVETPTTRKARSGPGVGVKGVKGTTARGRPRKSLELT
jgi:hypothetical protein